MTKVTTFGDPIADTLLPSELNNIQDDYEKLFANRITLLTGTFGPLESRYNALLDHLIGPVPSVYGSLTISTNIVPNPDCGSLWYWEPNEWAAMGGRAIKLRLRSALLNNSSASIGVGITVGLRRMTSDSAPVTAEFETGSGVIVVTHPTPPDGTDLNKLESERNLTTSPLERGWYGVFAHYSGAPAGSTHAMLYTDLSLKLE